MRKLLERLEDVVTLLLVLAAAYAFTRPGAPVRSAVAGWWRAFTEPRRIAALWPRLVQGASRLDTTSAPIRLIEFADFQCPFCRADHAEVVRFIARHPTVGVGYLHLPLPMHPAAEPAALAAICAERQGDFRRFQDYLFKTAAWQQRTDWQKVAHATGVPDTAAFARCLASPEATMQLGTDEDFAQALGITGTPSFVTRRRVAEGAQSDSALAALLGLKP